MTNPNHPYAVWVAGDGSVWSGIVHRDQRGRYWQDAPNHQRRYISVHSVHENQSQASRAAADLAIRNNAARVLSARWTEEEEE